ncbi:MAG: Aspartate 1-decarboxylase [Gammaproteobacteria bacterium]|jgi:aspartate 1-decarboxylase|nr:Aspartate 1-decarboxylase [Gammaproteobacteria bacterium]
MLQILLKSKLHHARVTHAELEYEGSCGIDTSLMEAVGILENEQIQIYNLNNGARFTTYAIKAPSGSRMISINGAAAHKANPGDRIIICTYAWLNQQEILTHQPKVAQLGAENNIISIRTELLSCPA